MKIRVLYFAAARERAGTGEEIIELADGADLGGLLAAVEAAHPELGGLRAHLRFAVNQAFVKGEDGALSDGDEVAVIPPVSGGAPEMVRLTHEPLDPEAVSALVAASDRGGRVQFVGTVRDHTGDHAVTRLEYEAYEPMVVKVFEQIRAEADARWPGIHVAIHHRLGVLQIGDAAVVIGVSTPHRAEAFAACQFVIDRLKEDAPIFKKEVRGDGTIWVGLGP
jgi:molybdopterin synthase catalytic subunit